MADHSTWDLDCKVYIGGLGDGADKDEIEHMFSRYGNLRNIWVARNPPGFAFVEYVDSRDAEDSVRELDGTLLNGRRIRVEKSTGKTKATRPYGSKSLSRSRSRSRSRSVYSNRSRTFKRIKRRSRSRSRSYTPERRYKPRGRSLSRSRSRSRSYRRSWSRSSSRSYSDSQSESYTTWSPQSSSNTSSCSSLYTRRSRSPSYDSPRSKRKSSRHRRKKKSSKKSPRVSLPYSPPTRRRERSPTPTERVDQDDDNRRSPTREENQTSPVPVTVTAEVQTEPVEDAPTDAPKEDITDRTRASADASAQTDHYLLLYYIQKAPDIMSETFLRLDRDNVLNNSEYPEIIPSKYQRKLSRVPTQFGNTEATPTQFGTTPSQFGSMPTQFGNTPTQNGISEPPVEKTKLPAEATEAKKRISPATNHRKQQQISKVFIEHLSADPVELSPYTIEDMDIPLPESPTGGGGGNATKTDEESERNSTDSSPKKRKITMNFTANGPKKLDPNKNFLDSTDIMNRSEDDRRSGAVTSDHKAKLRKKVKTWLENAVQGTRSINNDAQRPQVLTATLEHKAKPIKLQTKETDENDNDRHMNMSPDHSRHSCRSSASSRTSLSDSP